jgi:hypothetical protein
VQDDERFDLAFDELEVFLGVVYAWTEGGYGPFGLFAYKDRPMPTGVLDRHAYEILAAGLFDGSGDMLAETLATYANRSPRIWG